MVFLQVNVSLYGRLFNESFRLYYLRNIFTAFAVGLSGWKLKNARKFFLIAADFGYLVLRKRDEKHI